MGAYVYCGKACLSSAELRTLARATYEVIEMGHSQLLKVLTDLNGAVTHVRVPEQHPSTQTIQHLATCDYRNEQG